MEVKSNAESGQADTSSGDSQITVPLNEVAYGARFVAPDFDVVHFGEFYDRIRAAFPDRETQPPIARPPTGPFMLQTIEVPALPRLWCVNDSRLVQLQLDRFIYNWRRQDGKADKYPGFETLFGEFKMQWAQFLGFADESFSIPFALEELSLTYVNLIHSDETVGAPIFTFRKEVEGMPEPELWVSQLRFQFPEKKMKVTVGTRPGIHLASQENVTQLDVTIESTTPPADKRNGTFAWFEAAHDLLHHSFASLVSPEWREKWGFSSR